MSSENEEDFGLRPIPSGCFVLLFLIFIFLMFCAWLFDFIGLGM